MSITLHTSLVIVNDAAVLAECLDLLRTTWPDLSRDSFFKWFHEDPSCILYLYRTDTTKLVAMGITDLRTIELAENQWYLSNFCVHPDYRRQNIATRLFEYILRSQQTKLWFYATKPAACAFYESRPATWRHETGIDNPPGERWYCFQYRENQIV